MAFRSFERGLEVVKEDILLTVQATKNVLDALEVVHVQEEYCQAESRWFVSRQGAHVPYV